MSNTPEKAANPVYTVTWRRPGETEWLQCSGLSLRTAVARALAVARQHGHVEVRSLTRDLTDCAVPS